jgi:hypothetical protein
MTFAVFCSLILTVSGAAYAADRPIGGMFDGKGPVKVYVNRVENQSGKAEVEPDLFKKSLERNLAERKTHDFKLVDNPAESDIQISAVIKNFQYLDRGPLKPIPVMGLSALDAAATATQNYTEISVQYAVIATRTGETLWDSGVADYIKRVMTPKESLPLIYDRITRIFLWKCFGKARGVEVSARSR